jgi:hypothetical protein
MPLLDLKTNLKSLKYGQDQPGGGNSGQPYQQVDINKVDSGFNRFRITKFDDGLVRGGVVGAANASIVDTLRIGKFLTDFPKGPLFIAKQVGLQLANPKLEAKKLNTSLPTAGQGFLRNVGNVIANTANKIVNAVGPTRIYNLGINTLAQVPLNAFGQHIIRHGLLPRMDDSTKYLAVVQNNDAPNTLGVNNRLVGLKGTFRLGDMTSSANPQFFTNAQRRAAGQVIAGLFSLATGTASKPKPVGFLNANGELTIDRYIGGAQSVYGIGNTTILRRIFTEDAARIDAAKNKNYNSTTIPTILIRKTTDFEISTKTKSIFGKTTGSNTNNPFGLSSAGTIETFNLSGGTNGSFLNFIASNRDKVGVNFTKLKASLDNASKNIPNFLKLSTKSNSKFNPTSFPGLRVSPNIPATLLDKIASNNDKTSVYANKSKGKVGNADEKARAGNFRQASLNSSSSFSLSGSFGTISSPIYGLNEITKLRTYNGPKTWTPLNGVVPRKINPDTILGVGPQSISTYEQKVTNVYVEPSNVIPYGASKTYATLKSKIVTSISQPTAIGAGGTNFKTETLTVKTSTGRNPIPHFNRTNDKVVSDDTLALVFNPLDPFTGNSLKTLSFLGYITDYSENYDSGWGDVKYVGRAESFYIFNSFKRTLNVGFNIPCFNKDELEKKHCTLSELASVLAGKYSDNGLLGGIITRLKVGGYINNQPGIINNLTFQPIQDSSWDLDSGFAFYLKVSFGFTVIHNFLPQFKDCGFLKDPPKKTEPPPPPPKPKTPPPPSPPPPAPTPVPVPSTGSIVPLPDLGATRQRAAIDNTYVAPPPTIVPVSRRFGGFRDGSLGGGGAGTDW